MPTAHLIHGYIGSGKSTLARRLEREHNALRFCHDEWMVALYGQDPPAELFQEYASRVSALIESQWVQAVRAGVDVVLDLGFWSRSQRDATRELVGALGAQWVLYSLSAPDEELWARVSRRNAEPGSLFIARATFDALKQRFEPLGDDERDC